MQYAFLTHYKSVELAIIVEEPDFTSFIQELMHETDRTEFGIKIYLLDTIMLFKTLDHFGEWESVFTELPVVKRIKKEDTFEFEPVMAKDANELETAAKRLIQCVEETYPDVALEAQHRVEGAVKIFEEAKEMDALTDTEMAQLESPKGSA